MALAIIRSRWRPELQYRRPADVSSKLPREFHARTYRRRAVAPLSMPGEHRFNALSDGWSHSRTWQLAQLRHEMHTLRIKFGEYLRGRKGLNYMPEMLLASL